MTENKEIGLKDIVKMNNEIIAKAADEKKKPAPKRKVKPKIPLPTENQEHRALAEWLDMQRWARGRWFHIPNERWDKIEAAKMKQVGVKPGLPDIVLLYPIMPENVHRMIPGMVIELKRRDATPSRLPQEQREWLTRFLESGFRVRVSRGWEDAKDALKNFALRKNPGKGFIELPEGWEL